MSARRACLELTQARIGWGPRGSAVYSKLLVRSGWARARSPTRAKATQVEGVSWRQLNLDWTEKLVKTQYCMSKRAGQQSERGRHSQGIMGYSVLNLLAIKIQSEMGGDTDDLISSKNVTVLIGKISIFGSIHKWRQIFG